MLLNIFVATLSSDPYVDVFPFFYLHYVLIAVLVTVNKHQTTKSKHKQQKKFNYFTF